MEAIFQAVDNWYSTNQSDIIAVLFIISGAVAIKVFGDSIIRRAIHRSIKSTAHIDKEEEKKREDTIIQLVTGALSILVWPIGGILILSQIGVNIAPLIAGASIVGVAVGLGAQNIVKDVLSGLFIIAENQYRVGDVVELDEKTMGYVEKITLRVTVLRDLAGVVHHVSNSNIIRTSNFSKDFSGIDLDIAVNNESDLDKVIQLVNRVGKEMAHDPEWKHLIMNEPKFLRVNDFGDGSVVIKITGTVKPMTQWDVTGELRKRLKHEFDKSKVKILPVKA